MLKIGDKIRITGLPSVIQGILPNETKRVWEKLAKRGRYVVISSIDDFGQPWYNCRFKKRDGTWEHHFLSVGEGEDNWTLVQSRKK